ncbi:MAG: nitroreductase family protein, partial [Gammaproteobacteria bacterium]|nr:nitroreductase family protein [Gammaproteobacteria bacterium]
MGDPRFVALESYVEYPQDEMRQRARAFRDDSVRRRTVRDFSDRPVPMDVIRDCLESAGSAPSGANMQPWHFSVVTDPDTKHRIRVAAEEEERHFYEHRASDEWLAALEPLGTDSNKPFLEIAPVLIAIFQQKYGFLPDGRKVKHYYPGESVGLATGIL